VRRGRVQRGCVLLCCSFLPTSPCCCLGDNTPQTHTTAQTSRVQTAQTAAAGFSWRRRALVRCTVWHLPRPAGHEHNVWAALAAPVGWPAVMICGRGTVTSDTRRKNTVHSAAPLQASITHKSHTPQGYHAHPRLPAHRPPSRQHTACCCRMQPAHASERAAATCTVPRSAERARPRGHTSLQAARSPKLRPRQAQLAAAPWVSASDTSGRAHSALRRHSAAAACSRTRLRQRPLLRNQRAHQPRACAHDTCAVPDVKPGSS
jgi:hypothetical protein